MFFLQNKRKHFHNAKSFKMLEKNNTLTQFQFLDCESKISHPQMKKKKKKQNRINPTKKLITSEHGWTTSRLIIFSKTQQNLYMTSKRGTSATIKTLGTAGKRYSSVYPLISDRIWQSSNYLGQIMNPLKALCVVAFLAAAVCANQQYQQQTLKLKPTQWLSPSQLKQTPSADEISVERLENMSLEEGAKALQTMCKLSIPLSTIVITNNVFSFFRSCVPDWLRFETKLRA